MAFDRICILKPAATALPSPLRLRADRRCGRSAISIFMFSTSSFFNRVNLGNDDLTNLLAFFLDDGRRQRSVIKTGRVLLSVG